MQWFRLYSEARNDAKLRALTDAQHRVWFHLLCFAAEQDGERRGSFPAEDLDLLAVEVANGDIELLNATLDTLQRLRMVSLGAGWGTFLRFLERQYDKPSDRPERVAERVSRHRAKQALQGVTGVTARVSNAAQRQEGHAQVPKRSENGAAGNALYRGRNGGRNAAVTPSNAPYTDTESDSEIPTPSGVGAPDADAPAARATPKPNKSGELLDAVKASGDVPIAMTAADHAALKKSPLTAAQVAEVYVALARGEHGTDWQQDNLSVSVAIKAWAGYETAKRGRAVPKQRTLTTRPPVGAAALMSMSPLGGNNGRLPTLGRGDAGRGHRQADRQFPQSWRGRSDGRWHESWLHGGARRDRRRGPLAWLAVAE